MHADEHPTIALRVYLREFANYGNVEIQNFKDNLFTNNRQRL